ncbi:MAG: MCE family protein [Acetobacteraceae bacterium]|nr:MCE family protein [Acetobacteraceae bacterium]
MNDLPPDIHGQPPAVLSDPRVSRRRRLSLIWAIPVITALIGGWLLWDTLSKLGPTITITFQSAEGLQVNQSHVKHKDVDMGTVSAIELTPDRNRVQVKVEMRRAAAPLLTEGAQFWVVRPRFFAGSLSGLETLVSGSYIELSPATDRNAPSKRDFVGLEEPPVQTADVPGRTFLLQAGRIGSINLGSPVYFRDLDVGTVLGWDLGDMAQNVTLHVFVRAPFDQYVHNNSRFWNASGFSVKLGAEGVQFQIESLKAVLLGGIAFDTPPVKPSAVVSAADTKFHLFDSRELAEAAAYSWRVPLVSYFQGSVRGLAAGAPVELYGIRVGQVTDVRLQYDSKSDQIVVPVHYEVEPQRIADSELVPAEAVKDRIAQDVDHGLRAQLEAASLLTGQKLISLDIVAHAPPAHIAMEGEAIVLPTSPGGGFDSMTQAASEVLAKVNAIPFEQIGANLNETLAGINQLANGQELRDSLASLHATLNDTQDLVKRLDAGMQPALKQLPAIASGLQDTVAHTNKLLDSLDRNYAGNSTFGRDLNRLLAQLNDAASSIRVLADLLTRHPEALIRGRTDTGLQ